ncbi:MAG: molybdopterin cofactor-binding domain-containing protein, partial [Polyangiaceae bacterium]
MGRKMMDTPRSRREFFRDLSAVSAGLVVAVHLPACAQSRWPIPNPVDRGDGSVKPSSLDDPGFMPNAFLRVTTDDRIIFVLARTEMGQGVYTSETMLVAEELNIDPAEIEIVAAPAHRAYVNPMLKMQITGASSSTRTSFEPLRAAAAVVREALVGAGAAKWGVPPSEVRLKGKVVIHQASKRKVQIGTLAVAARDFVDDEAKPKPRSQWKLLGTSPRRLDAQQKVNGTAQYGADVDLPGLEVAVVMHGPTGSRLMGFDAGSALDSPGVKAVFAIEAGVAVVAERYDQVRKAADKVKVEWSPSEVSSAGLLDEYSRRIADDDLSTARSDGDVGEVLESASEIISAEYRFPFLAHMALEPMTATAWVKENHTCEIWAPTQSTAACAWAGSHAGGVRRDDVTVHQTFIGGGFGRKSYVDVVLEAAEISKVRRAPVRVLWSREDDVQCDAFRPATVHRIRAVMNDKRPVAWQHATVGQTALFTEGRKETLTELVPEFMTGVVLWGARTFSGAPSLVEGSKQLRYDIPNIEVKYAVADEVVHTGIWRSVGHSQNAFVLETFIDELATRAGEDPYRFRRDLLSKSPRHLGVLDLAAEKAGWG